ncbi:MAG TPA: ribonuclease HII [Candidatus Limnocylindria bacterium]|nr:ribonuclease HII [Candidatus Limnocylindria bacterium]
MAVKARRSERIIKPSTRVERAHWNEGRGIIVGADAVGVACLSGPVLAAAVAMPPFARRIPGVRDSKMLSRAQRERLFPLIIRRALAVGIGAASVAEIDRINIYHATNLAMRRAICRVEPRDHVLIDGLRVHRLEDHVGSYTAIVRGDAKCYSIAAASIVAKVIRDRLMDRLATRHPFYGWEHNAGYATATHRRGIEEHGITPFHRRSFARVRAVELGEQMELDFDALVPMLVPA